MTTEITTIEEINGQWFAAVGYDSIDASELRWANRGNGLELTAPDYVHGPFASEAEAQLWLTTYLVD